MKAEILLGKRRPGGVRRAAIQDALPAVILMKAEILPETVTRGVRRAAIQDVPPAVFLLKIEIFPEMHIRPGAQ